MFSLDELIVKNLPKMGELLIQNKFSLLLIWSTLFACANKTKTTLDNRILTFLKNTFLRIFGQGKAVDKKYEFFKNKNLINSVMTKDDIKKAEEEFDKKVK